MSCDENCVVALLALKPSRSVADPDHVYADPDHFRLMRIRIQIQGLDDQKMEKIDS